MLPRKDLGSLLVDEDVLDRADLERVDGERAGQPLWAALLEAGLASEEEIFSVLAARFGAPVLQDETVIEARMPEELRRHLSREQALASGLLPIERAANGARVGVAMVDPSDEAALNQLLRRAQIPEGYALLARRSALDRAIQRNFGWLRGGTQPRGSVELDPQLAAEIGRLPERGRELDPLTPRPERAARRAPTPVAPAPEPTHDEALQSEERLSRTLIQAVQALANELEARVQSAGYLDPSRAGRPGLSAEMARLSRRVAAELALGRRAEAEIGIAAHLFAVDRLLRAAGGEAGPDPLRFSELGWAAAGEGGLLPILRALTAASVGFGRAHSAQRPLGARIIDLVGDYLELGAASGGEDLGTVLQLLRASSAGAPVVDALLAVLEADRAEPATDAVALPATSMLTASSRRDAHEE